MTAARFLADATNVTHKRGGVRRRDAAALRGQGQTEAATVIAKGGGATTALQPDHHEHQAGHLQVSARFRGVQERRDIWGPSPGPRAVGLPQSCSQGN